MCVCVLFGLEIMTLEINKKFARIDLQLILILVIYDNIECAGSQTVACVPHVARQ